MQCLGLCACTSPLTYSLSGWPISASRDCPDKGSECTCACGSSPASADRSEGCTATGLSQKSERSRRFVNATCWMYSLRRAVLVTCSCIVQALFMYCSCMRHCICAAAANAQQSCSCIVHVLFMSGRAGPYRAADVPHLERTDPKTRNNIGMRMSSFVTFTFHRHFGPCAHEASHVHLA